MKSLQITLLMLVMGTAYGQTPLDQSVIPPSPNSASLIKLAGFPVNEYAGTAHVNIPIYSLPSRTIDIPVSLNYRASGIRVQEIASSVGLGWNLNAGGRITRVVRHLPDYSEPGCGDPETGLNINVALAEACDSEMDVFYYSILGRSGKFYIDASNNFIYPVPANDMKFSYSPSFDQFIIVDEKGYMFTFGASSSRTEVTDLYSSNELGGTAYRKTDDRSNDPGKYELKSTFNSSWVLNEILSPSRLSLARFQYETSDITFENYSERIKFDDRGGQGEQYFTDTKLRVRQCYLTRIETDLGGIDFNYQSGRKDLDGGKRLASIVITNEQNLPFKTYDFEHHYYDKYQIYSVSTTAENCASDFNCNRLLLSKIVEDGITAYSFDYEDDNAYIFPRRYSPHFDHWGFSTARFNMYPNEPLHEGYSSAIPKIVASVAGTPFPEIRATISGSNKNRHFEASKALTLKQVNFATGGYQRFVYEAHDLGIGGLRIKEIRVSDGGPEWVDVAYTYSGAYAVGNPRYHYSPYDFQWVGKSVMFKQQYDLDGRAIGYSTVKKTFTDGSYITNDYSNGERPDGNPANSVVSVINGTFDSFNQTGMSVNGPPFTSRTSYSWERGVLVSSQWHKANGELARKVQNVPDYTLPLILNQESFVADQGHEVTISGATRKLVNLGQYNVVTKYLNFEESTVYNYDQENPLKENNSRTIFTYHPTHKTLVSSKRVLLADGTEIKTTYKYPVDYPSVASSDTRVKAQDRIRLNNALNEPVETVTYFKKPGDVFKVVGAYLLTYKLYEVMTTGGFTFKKALPYEIFELRLTDASVSFTDSYIHGTTNELIWDTKYKKVQEFDYDPVDETLRSVMNESGIEQEYQYNANGYLMFSVTNPPGTNIREDYAYHNLNVSRVTDTNSKYIDYIYDSKNRLKLVKDKDNNIIQRYRYHYDGEVETSAEFSISGTLHINKLITFNAEKDPPPIGQTTYYWDFGDGQVIETTAKNVSHTYSVRGTYTVTLVMVNPDYEAVHTSQTIIIHGPFSNVTTCINGPRRIDACDIEDALPGSCTTGSVGFSTRIILNVSYTGGCPGVTYSWRKNFNGGPWSGFGGNANSALLFINRTQVGTTTVKCIITDSCGNSAESSTQWVQVYKSLQGCAGGIDP